MPPIHEYDNYRKYLGDFYAEKKAGPRGFSYEIFSRLAGLKSANYMKLVIDGKRNLTVTNIHLVARALKLTLLETRYFEALVLHNQAKQNHERAYYQTRIRELKQNTGEVQVKRVRIEELIAAYYYPAVVVCLHELPIADATQVIQKKTGLNEIQIETALKALRSKGFILEKDGRFFLSDKYLLLHDQTMSDQIHKNFLQAQLQFSQRTLEKRYAKDAKFFSQTFTTAASLFPNYVEKLTKFIDELMNEANLQPAEQVLQLNIQFFPYQ